MPLKKFNVFMKIISIIHICSCYEFLKLLQTEISQKKHLIIHETQVI